MYEAFYELLCDDEADGELEAADGEAALIVEIERGGEGGGGDAPAAPLAVVPTRQRSRVEPRLEEELRLLYEAFRTEEPRSSAKIEEAERARFERARQSVADKLAHAVRRDGGGLELLTRLAGGRLRPTLPLTRASRRRRTSHGWRRRGTTAGPTPSGCHRASRTT